MPLEGAQGGIRFEQLSLIGIMYSPDPSASVAVVSTGGVAVAADGSVYVSADRNETIWWIRRKPAGRTP